MSLEQMKRYVDLCLDAYPDTITFLSLTGGECFLLGDDLKAIIKYGMLRGLHSSLISNGYWGRSYKRAVGILSELQAAGLWSIAFSTGEAHQKWVPMRSVRNAAVAAARLGLKCEVRVESRFGRTKWEQQISNDAPFRKLIEENKIRLEWWRWREYNNEINHGLNYPFRLRHSSSKPCDLLFRDIIITPYGDVLACCGLSTIRIPQMRLGNIDKEPVKVVYERAFQDALKAWLRREGPEAVLQYVYDNSDIKFHSFGPNCSACNEIFRNPKIVALLNERYDDWIEKVQFGYI